MENFSAIDEYIIEMESDIDKLQKEKETISKQLQYPIQDIEMLKIVREELRNFVMQIKTERPENQHALLKKYLISVSKELSVDNFKLHYTIAIPGSLLDGAPVKMLEKTIYFSLES